MWLYLDIEQIIQLLYKLFGKINIFNWTNKYMYNALGNDMHIVHSCTVNVKKIINK